jgi:hypothetical protein
MTIDVFPQGTTVAWPRRLAPWLVWSLVFAPIGIVLHEVGHLLVAQAIGFPNPTLHFSGVDPGESAGLPSTAVGWVALAGPLVSAGLALIGCAWMRWRAADAWAAALAIAAVSRFAVALPYTIASAVVRVLGVRLAPPEFDEYKVGAALGWSGDALLAVTSLFLLAVLWWVHRATRRDDRRVVWAGLVIGTVAGWAVWMKGLGPWLLP